MAFRQLPTFSFLFRRTVSVGFSSRRTASRRSPGASASRAWSGRGAIQSRGRAHRTTGAVSRLRCAGHDRESRRPRWVKAAVAGGHTTPCTLDGPQLAGWRPKVSSQRKFPIRCEPDIPVVLPDGTTLRGDLYRPDVAGRYPALVAWSTYPKELQQTGLPLPLNEAGVSGYLAQHGYAHLIVSARGTGRSGGDHQPQLALQEQKDVADAIEWVATQEWCDGSVGMVGMSYFAIIQYLAAARRPPHLKAIFPFVGLSD